MKFSQVNHSYSLEVRRLPKSSLLVAVLEILYTQSCSRRWALTGEAYGRMKALTSMHSME